MPGAAVLRLGLHLVNALTERIGWQKLPLPLGVLALLLARIRLRQDNLFDTNTPPIVNEAVLQGTGPRYLVARSPDGSHNDLAQPRMGSTGTRFGRNAPPGATQPESPARTLTPNPRVVSKELLTRDAFIPATTLNLLAAAWLQFEVHDWLSHGRNEPNDPWQVPLAEDDDWPERPMRILRTGKDPTAPPGQPNVTFQNTATAWWDASQIYGSGLDMLDRLRSGERGKLRLDANGLLPLDEHGIDLTGVSGNWWLGLSLMHTLFVLEHNAIAERFAREYPAWSDDDVFDHARLVNAALIAKIHTLEWTPAIVAHPTVQYGMRTNWWGLEMERLSRLFGRLSSDEVISGIPGSPTDHNGVPYSITEEFVAVYRMHPLLPDDISLRSAEDNHTITQLPFPEIAFANARKALQETGLTNALYSFGTLHPGAITLHNYPRHLQHLVDLQGNLSDLAAIDILRNRERGVPRYNDFRALVHKPRLQRFEQLSTNAEWVEQIRRVYNNDLDSVDLMVGLYAEPLPAGFGFSDTAFRIFILMASRRLKSDRFFTRDYTPRVYTQLGLDWINANSMSAVLVRHAPGLAATLRAVDNAFAPWPLASGGTHGYYSGRSLHHVSGRVGRSVPPQPTG